MEQDYRHQPTNQDLAGIPGDDGWPLLGSGLGFVKDVLATTRERVARYGEVSRIKLGPERGLLVVGADNYQRIFIDKERCFSAEMGYAQQLGRFYEGGLLLHDFEEHKFQRRIMQKSFKFSTMQHYVPVLNEILKRHLLECPVGEAFTFYPRIKHALLEVGSRIFLGVEGLGKEAEVLNDAFLEIADGLSSILPLNLPGSKIHRGLKGKKTLHQFVSEQIPLRRAGDGDDMLSHMTQEKTEEGNYYSDEEIIQHTAFLLFAAHDTTTSALTHLMMYLGRYPEWQQRLREESLAVGKAELAYEDLEQLPLMEQCFNEVLRLHPTVPVMTRRTIREVELSGVTIPAHTQLYLPTSYNHRDPQFWSNPEQFDPERFSPERAENKRHSYCFHPFGGGAHKCIGMHFAVMLSKCFMHQLLLRYRFETHEGDNPQLEWVPIPKPADGVRMTLYPLN